MPLETHALGFSHTAHAPPLLAGIDFCVKPRERVCLTAPSGYGKTTFAKLLAGHERPTQGGITIGGAPLPAKGRCPVQLVSQHPEHAVNPRWKLRRTLCEAGPPAPELLAALGIEPAWLSRYPYELSGGELQRFCVARALLSGAAYLIADELSAMLDPITQAQIWNLLLEESRRRGFGLVVITHSPALAARVCTRTVDFTRLNRAAPA